MGHVELMMREKGEQLLDLLDLGTDEAKLEAVSGGRGVHEHAGGRLPVQPAHRGPPAARRMARADVTAGSSAPCPCPQQDIMVRFLRSKVLPGRTVTEAVDIDAAAVSLCHTSGPTRNGPGGKPCIMLDTTVLTERQKDAALAVIFRGGEQRSGQRAPAGG